MHSRMRCRHLIWKTTGGIGNAAYGAHARRSTFQPARHRHRPERILRRRTILQAIFRPIVRNAWSEWGRDYPRNDVNPLDCVGMGIVDMPKYLCNDVNLPVRVGMGMVDVPEYLRNDANVPACGVMVRMVRMAGWYGRCGRGIPRAMDCRMCRGKGSMVILAYNHGIGVNQNEFHTGARYPNATE